MGLSPPESYPPVVGGGPSAMVAFKRLATGLTLKLQMEAGDVFYANKSKALLKI